MSHDPGRPREFTHPKRRELLDHIGQGASIEEAAQIVGVSLRTVQRAAKYNEHFHHDLHLALHAAPVDPHQLMLRAARTHWRAAAWLLERTDPDRFAKRPPNSCRPETLMDVSAWLIETALESTPPEQREAVYRRMHAVADKAFDVLMPDQHDARRSLAGALPDRPMPLSAHEWRKTLEVVRDRPAAATSVATDVAGSLPAAEANRAASAPPRRELDDKTPTASPAARRTATAPSAATIADPVAYYRAQPPRKPPAGRPSSHLQGFRLLDSADMDADWRYPLPDEEDADDAAVGAPAGVSAADSVRLNQRGKSDPVAEIEAASDKAWSSVKAALAARNRADVAVAEFAATMRPESAERDEPPPSGESKRAPQPAAGQASTDPPNGGIMSPKMSAATEVDAAECDAAECDAAEFKTAGAWPMLEPDPPTVPISGRPTLLTHLLAAHAQGPR